MLCVVGDVVEDVIVRPRRAAVRVDTDNPASIERRRGGSAANVAAAAAVAAAAVAGGAGPAVRFIGRVGHDATGDGLVDELTAAGVDVRVQRDGRTGTVVVLVEPGGVRTMYPDRAAAGQLGAIEPSWAEGVTWLHVPDYTWCTDGMGDAAADFAALVRRAGAAKLSVDVSSVAVVDEYGPARFNALLTSVRPDVVLATRDEAARLERDAPWLVVIKDGPRPVTIRYPEGTVEHVDVAPVAHVVDPTGAGDAFAAGYVVAAMGGATARRAAMAGSALAARTLARVGASVR